MARHESAALIELRVLDGPNLYFTRPAIKLTLLAKEWLEADDDTVVGAAIRLKLRGAARAAGRARPDPPAAGSSRPGPPGSDRRLRFVVRIAAHLTRELARTAGAYVAVRSRPGSEPNQIIVAYPWRRRSAAEGFGREVAGLFEEILTTDRVEPLLGEAGGRLQRVEPGPAPTVPEPRVPVVAVTGTNGKTTTVRLLTHLIRTAGMTVAYSSTDGVYLDGERVEEGDYSGFGGAGMALSQEGVQAAVLETARGGILLRGIGTMHNDVAVVTNVSADHLGMHGIHTLDQLAEVKATILRITKTDGWDVLNADDPRVLAMRRVARGRTWLFSLDPDHPALRSVLAERGRGLTVIDGALSVWLPGRDPQPLLQLEDVPVTLAGISSQHIQNAMAATAAGLGMGLPEEAVIEGLRSFVLDPETNPGRANLFELNGRVVVVDYAHNEAGMQGLLEVCQGLRRPGREIWVTFSSAGDRSDEVIHGMGFLAARGSDHVAVCELLRYLRGRDRDDLKRRLVAGAEDGGATNVPVFPDEVHALEWMLESSRSGDVVALTSLGQRPEIFELLDERGADRVMAERCREIVREAGEQRVTTRADRTGAPTPG
jgi:cyanophycin synthetase